MNTNTQPKTSGSIWVGYSCMLIGIFMVVLDLSVADVLIPTIVESLHLAAADAASVVTIYLAVVSSCIVLLGKVSDIIGARKGYLLGLLLFAAGSLVTGSATGLTSLLIGRVIQGLGMGLVVPSSVSLLNHQFPNASPSRAFAFSLWTTAIGSAMAVGPLFGGAAATYLSWRWAFCLNVPIAIVAIIGVYFTIQPIAAKLKERGIDYLGALLLIVSISLLILGLQISSSEGWWQTRPAVPTQPFAWYLNISPVPFYILFSVIVMVLFSTRESRREKRQQGVVLEMSLFKSSLYSWCTLVLSLMTGVSFGIMVMVPLYSAYVLDYNAFHSGLTLLPMGIGMAIGGLLISKVNLTKPHRIIMALLAIQLLATVALIPLLSVHGHGWYLAAPLLIQGTAWGATYTILVNISMLTVPKLLSGVAAGAQIMGRTVACALCAAVMTSIAIGYMETQRDTLDLSALDQQQIHQVLGLYNFSGQLHPRIVSPDMTVIQARKIEAFNTIINDFRDETVTATQQALFFATIIALLTLLCGFYIRDQTESTDEQAKSTT